MPDRSPWLCLVRTSVLGISAVLPMAAVAQQLETPPVQTPPREPAIVPGDVPGAGLGSPTITKDKESVRPLEGVVTRLSPAPKDLADGRILLTIDSTQTWNEYAAKRPERPAGKAEDTTAADGPKAMTVLITRQTRVYTFPRNADGQMVAGATASAPTAKGAGTTPATTGSPDIRHVKPSNFTNIREGSFVGVHATKDEQGQMIATSLSLIEMPARAAVPKTTEP